jgi:hypothetical protein
MQKRSPSSILFVVMTLVLVITIAFGSVSPAQAAEIRRGGVLNSGETIDDDLIISGNQVQVDGTVNGMLIAAGQTVTLNGTINGDAFLFGQDVIVAKNAVIQGNLFSGARTVVVYGEVTGSIAGGAASMQLSGKVGRNIYFGGYSLETQPGSTAARGLYFGGYQAILKGSIAKDLNASAGAVQLDGSVGGNVQLDVAPTGHDQNMNFYGPYGAQLPTSIPSGLRIGPEAKIGGKLVYTSSANQDTAVKAAPAGGIVYQTPVPNERTNRPYPVVVRPVMPVLSWMFNFARNFITLLVLGLLAVWLLPLVARNTSEMVRAKPAESAGYGLLTIIVGYIGAFFAALIILALGLFFTVVTLGGLSRVIFGIGFSGLSLVVTAFTLLVSYASKLVVAYLVGDLILAGAAPNLNGRRYWAIALGVLIYALIRSIPFLGWIVGIIVTIIGVGAMWLYYRSRRTQSPAITPAVVEPAA